MKYLKLYENWLRKSDDKELIEVADYIDDILLDIGDMEFPYVYPSFIHDHTTPPQISFEISATSDNSITEDKYELTNEIYSIIERCDEYVESVGYQMEIYVRWGAIENATLGEYVEGQGANYMKINGLKEYIGKEIHYVAITITKKNTQ